MGRSASSHETQRNHAKTFPTQSNIGPAVTSCFSKEDGRGLKCPKTKAAMK